MTTGQTVWTQCLLELVRIYQLRLGEPELKMSEVDRLAMLVVKELKVDASRTIQAVVGNRTNGFDDEVPF